MGQAYYHYNAAQVRELRNEIVSRLTAYCEAFSETAKRCNTIATTISMQGQGADKIKDYLSTVHSSVICSSFSGLAQLIFDGVTEYETQYHNLDSSIDAVIDTNELDEIKTALIKAKERFDFLSRRFSSLSASVADISAYQYNSDRSGLSGDIDDATGYIDKVEEGIGAIESAPYCIEAAKALLEKINERIHNGTWLSPESFDRAAYLSSAEYAAFYSACQTANKALNKYELSSEERENAISEIEAGWEERAKKADDIKLGVAIVESAAIIVAGIVLPAGGAVIVAAIVGGINGAVSETATQWSSGSAAVDEGYDYARITTKACWGSLRSMASTAISDSFSGMSMPGGSGKIAGNIFEETVTNVVDTGFDLLEAWYYDELGEETQRVFTEEYWTELMGKSVVTGSTKTVVKEGYRVLGDAAEKTVVFKNSAGRKAVLKTILGMEKKVTSKSIEDITDFVIETANVSDDNGYVDFTKSPSKEEWKQGWNKTINKTLDKAGERAIIGTLESAAPEITENAIKHKTKVAAENNNGISLYRRKTENAIEAIDVVQDEIGYTVINGVRNITIDEESIRSQESKYYTDYEKERVQEATSTVKAGTKSAAKLVKKHDEEEYSIPFFGEDTFFSDIPVPIVNITA